MSGAFAFPTPDLILSYEPYLTVARLAWQRKPAARAPSCGVGARGIGRLRGRPGSALPSVTAERALRDYATFASWELIAKATTRLENEMRDALNPATGTRATSPYDRLPSPQVIVASAAPLLRCNEPGGDPDRLHFRLDLRDGSLTTMGPAPSPTQRRWITDTLTWEALQPGPRFGTVSGRDHDSTTALVYGIKHAQYGAFADSAPIAVYGFLTCRSAVGLSSCNGVRQRGSATTGGEPRTAQRFLLTSYDAGGRYLCLAPGAADRFSHEVLRWIRPPHCGSGSGCVRPRQPVGLRLLHPHVSHCYSLLALSAWLGDRLQLRREHELARLRARTLRRASPMSCELLSPRFFSTGDAGSGARQKRRRAPRRGETIVQEARRLMRLVDNVLQYARLERGLAGLAPEPACWPRVCEASSPFAYPPLPGTLRVRTDLDEAVAATVDSGR